MLLGVAGDRNSSLWCLVSVIVLSTIQTTSHADLFLLRSGGRIEGELINRDESPRRKYVIRVGQDQEITLDRNQVRSFKIASEAQRQYARHVQDMPPTIDGHLKMSTWCRKNRLRDEEHYHLEQVIRLDPENETARRRLGFSRVDGQWVKMSELRKDRGLTLYRGRWRSAQELATVKEQENRERETKDWRRQIRLWRKNLEGRRADRAREELRSIADPAAVPALAELLVDEPASRARLLYVEILGRLDSQGARDALVRCALTDRDEDVRLTCLDHLERKPDARIVNQLTAALRSKQLQRVHRAAIALGRLKATEAVPDLIDALTRKRRIRVATNPGQIGASFGRGGNTPSPGLQLGSRTVVKEEIVNNRPVLDALVAITGINYRFDKSRWRRWYEEVNTPHILSLRRRA